jgi:hypothetical protein
LRRASIDDFQPEVMLLLAGVCEGFSETPNGMRDKCLAEEAFFFASEKAFVIFEPTPQGMFLTAAAWDGTAGIDAHLPQVEEIARGMGASRIVFRTKRHGFERRMPKDWAIDHVVWVKEF